MLFILNRINRKIKKHRRKARKLKRSVKCKKKKS